jgi:hypothetical protein
MSNPTERVVSDITDERQRQMSAEGWDTSHDDKHTDGELAQAGAVYALAGAGVVRLSFSAELNETVPQDWPWAKAYWKPKDKRSNLVRAAALIVAEIERLDRADQAPQSAGQAASCETLGDGCRGCPDCKGSALGSGWFNEDGTPYRG